MTSIDFWIGATGYNFHIYEADIWRDAMTGIGRWEVLLDPLTSYWPGMIAVDQGVRIDINGVTMMRGYVDDVETFIDRRGTYTDLYRLKGRDYGMDLAQLYISQPYQNTRADNVVQAALLAAGSEISYASPALAPFIDYEFTRTFLSDGIREIADKTNNLGANYDFYVDDTPAPGGPNLHFFSVGDPAENTVVQLISQVNNRNSNILSIDPLGEALGFGIKNYVELYTREVNDHWTDLNAVDFGTINCGATDETTIFLHGKGAIRATNNTLAPTQITIELDFLPGLYGYTFLDMHQSTTGKYDYYMYDTRNFAKTCRIGLEDVPGNTIWYYQAIWGGLGKCYQCTDQKTNNEWRKVTFPLGDESGIEGALMPGSTKGHWYQLRGAAFNWSQVRKIMFETQGDLINVGDFFIIDGLQIPNVEVFSIAQDFASQVLYGIRMKSFYRPDLKSQVEFDSVAPEILAKLKDPMSKLRVTTIGQTGSVYTGQTLQVLAPSSGINPLTTYRILSLHHKVVRASSESDYPGYTFTTDYDLVKHEVSGVTQNVDFERVASSNNPLRGYIPSMRNRQRFMSNPYFNVE